MKVFKSKSELFALGYTRYRKEKPSPVEICVVKMRLAITRNPQVKWIFLVALQNTGQIAATEIRTEYYFAVWDVNDNPLRVFINKLRLL
jgi:hypothetical protein